MTHGFFDLDLTAEGDTHIDDHHTVEDVGIVLGQAFGRTLGDFGGLCRFGHAFVPMDEALALAAVDISRRPFLVFDAPSPLGKIGTFDCQLVEEFWRAFTNNAMITLHLKIMHGRNLHHLFEAMFKAAGRALHQASRGEVRIRETLSTKGVI